MHVIGYLGLMLIPDSRLVRQRIWIKIASEFELTQLW